MVVVVVVADVVGEVAAANPCRVSITRDFRRARFYSSASLAGQLGHRQVVITVRRQSL